jgi:hypothetical protein
VSNRKKKRPGDHPEDEPGARSDCAAVREWFASRDGLRVPGGCSTCDAFQELITQADGLYLLRVHHDDWCETYQRIQAGRAS